jgi:serine/threonine protein kinase
MIADSDAAGSGAGPDELSPLARLVADVVRRLDDEGSAAIDAACREHPELADELRRRLDALEQVGLLGRARFGPYVLLRLLGRGGMGVVHLARDTRDGRLVALKALPGRLIRSATARERFRREARAVGQLDHPSIVRVVEAGESDGVPWFTMEWVDGRTLAELVDALRAMEVAAERLDAGHLAVLPGAALSAGRAGAWVETVCRLVLDVAEALEHAHAQGIVHRDVKPSNVLVDRDGRARLFDFGLARLEDAERVTLSGDFTGTLGYVAPEQIGGPSAALDARTDVYALGATMYELLTLRRPFEGATPAEVLRRIERAGPVPPRRLNAAVGRDVETVCLTALEKLPADRYATAADMAADLRAVLELRPIAAQGPRWPRRLRRWAAQHVAAAAAVALLAVLVVGAPIGLALANARIRAEAAIAREQGGRAARAQEHAERQTARATRALDFLFGLLRAPSPTLSGHDVRVRDLLDDAAARASAELADDPRVAADVLTTVGLTQYRLADHAQAEQALERAVALCRLSPGEPMDEVQARALAGLMGVHTATGRLDEAEAAGRAALAIDERLGGARSAMVAEDKCGLGIVAARRGDREAALALMREALTLQVELLGERAQVVADTRLNIASALPPGDAVERERLLLEAIAVMREDPAARGGSTRLSGALRSLAIVLLGAGRTDEARERLREALDVGLAAGGEEHPDVAATRVVLGIALAGTPQAAEAAPHLQAALPTLRRLAPASDGQLATALERLAPLRVAEERPAEAAALLREALDLRRRRDGEASPATTRTARALADALWRAGRADEARAVLHEQLEAAAELGGAEGEALAARCREDLAAIGAPAPGSEAAGTGDTSTGDGD